MQEPLLTVNSIFVQSRNLQTFQYIINPNNDDSSGRHSAKKEPLFKLLSQHCTSSTQAKVLEMLDTRTSFILDVGEDRVITLAPDFEMARELNKKETLEGMRNNALATEMKRKASNESGTKGRIGGSASDEIVSKMWKAL